MTEMITGVDLIQEQIKAAQGQVLRFKQEDIQIKARPLFCILAQLVGSSPPLGLPTAALHGLNCQRCDASG